MFRASALLSEDSDSIALNPAAQAGIKILVIADDIDRTTYEPFQEVLGVHEQEGIGGFCIHKHIDIAALMVFTTSHRAKKTKRLNAIVVSKRAATALQNVYVIGLAHMPFQFLVANLGDFSDKNKFFRQNLYYSVK